MGDLNAHIVLVENLEGKKLFEDTGLNAMIIIKWTRWHLISLAASVPVAE
jgi:hypothetical protein